MSPAAFDQTCRMQRDLLKAAIYGNPESDGSGSLKAMLAEYDPDAAISRSAVLNGMPGKRAGAPPAAAHVLRRP